MEIKNVRGFRVISNPARSEKFQPSPQTSGIQEALFPFDPSQLLIFVSFPDVSEDEFISTLNKLHPGVIVELRKAPRFDIGKLNRKIAFECFQRVGSKYFDLLTEYSEGEANKPEFFPKLQKVLSEHLNDKSPFMFLVSESDSTHMTEEAVLNWFKGTDKDWAIYCLPHPENVKTDEPQKVS